MATLQAERIGDVEEGENLAPPGEVDELGLTSEERAQFDGMKDADRGVPDEGSEEAEEVSEEVAPSTPPSPGVEAPAPAQAKQPAPPEEDDEPDQVSRDPRTGKEQRTISYGKHQRLLNKARADAETLRAQAEEGRINHAKLAERLAILNDALTAPQPPRQLTPQEQEYQRQQEIQQNPMLEETIDPSVDIAGALAQMQRRQVFMAQASMYQQETTQEAMAHETMVRDFTRDTQLFSQTEEGQHFFGLDGAYQHLKNSRLVELGLALFDKDPSDPQQTFTQAEINKMVEDFNTEEAWLVQNALQNGRSPAKTIMKHAQLRGWRPPQPQQAATPAPVVQPQVRRAAQQAPLARAPVPSAVAQIQAERAGQAASRSLSDGGGAPPSGPLTPKELLDMDDEQFGLYIDNLPPHALQALMGREFPDRR
jgi:hypothetical protein